MNVFYKVLAWLINSIMLTTIETPYDEAFYVTDQDSDDNIQAPPPSKKMHAGTVNVF